MKISTLMKLKILGVCGGNGVILHPFRKTLIGNIEPRSVFHTHNNVQWKLNFNSPIDKDSSVYYRKSMVEVIIGAPDCGHSSVMSYSRAKKLSDPNNNSSLSLYFDKIHFYQPKVFFMENLPKIMENIDFNHEFPEYRLKIFQGSVSKWGNSQISRDRVAIIGIRSDLPKKIDKLITLPKIDPSSLKTSGQLIKGLEELNPNTCNVREEDDRYICLYVGEERKITVRRARKLWVTKYKLLNRWPVNKANMKNQPGIYRNFANDYPKTVRKQNRQFNHNGYMLTPREMARIQGIPDSFKLWYDESQHLLSINKARTTVAKSPPYEMGTWFYDVLSKIEKYV